MTNLEWIRTLSLKELSDLLYDYWLPRGQYAWSDSRKGLMKVLSENHIERDCAKCKHQNNCYCIKGYGCPYEPKDEPQTDIRDLTDCDFCKERNCKDCEGGKDEPQTDCGDFADRLAYERGVKHAWEVAQKVFDLTVTFYEAEDVAKQIADASQMEPNLEQFRVGLEYYTDAMHFGKAKGESITTDKTEQTEPMTSGVVWTEDVIKNEPTSYSTWASTKLRGKSNESTNK